MILNDYMIVYMIVLYCIYDYNDYKWLYECIYIYMIVLYCIYDYKWLSIDTIDDPLKN